jgi:hypothetical protein
MSKGPQNVTSTQTNTNPLGQAQMPFLTNMWGQAAGLGGWNFDTNTVGPAVGQQYLDQLKNYAQNQANVAQGPASNLVPGSMNFVNSALTGQAGGYLPAATQTQGLNNFANAAANAGTSYGDMLSQAASMAPGTVSPYQTGLMSLAGQYGGLTGAGYNSYGGLNQFGNQAANAGQMTAAQLYGLAPQGMSSGYPSEQQLMANSGMAIGGNPAFSSGLMGLASGQYINPSTNPALAGTIQAATDPITKQFMTATAPLTDSGFEAGGRSGSGAQTNAQGQNQYALGQALQNATSNIVNNAYNTGLSTTLNAGNALGGLYNQGMANSSSAAAQAGQLGQAGVGLTGNLIQGGGAALNTGYGTGISGYGAGASALNSLGGTGLGGASSNYSMGGQLGLNALSSMMQGLNYGAGATNAGYGTGISGYGAGGNLANAGTLNLGSLAQMAPELANYPSANLAAAYNTGWAPIQNYAGVLGQPIGGNTISQTTQPYYQNTGSQILSGLTGGAQLIGALAAI